MTVASRIVVVVLVLARVAAAQPPTDEIGAEALFREGRRLLKDGHIPEACDKLEASERLARSVGTLLNLADCREKNAQLATAWATFLEAASAARAANDPARETEARARARALEPKLSYLTISVPAASQVEGLTIARDGTLVDAALWNQGVPVDAGTYEIVGRAPGHEPWSTRVQVAGGQKTSVEVPRFKRIEDFARPQVTSAPPASSKPAGPEPEPADHDEQPAPQSRTRTFTPLREVSLGTAAVGLVAIAAGIRYGLTAKDLQRESDALCPARECSDPHALDLNASARHDALTGDILLGAGGAAIAGAVVLWLVGAPAQLAVARDGVSVAIGGRF